jgi:signal transduction histidine kinase
LLHLVGNDVLPVEHNERLANDDVFSLQRDRQGRLWFATASLGVGVIAEGRLSLIGTSEGLPDVGPVTTVLPDLEGGLWMPTLRGVLMMRSEDLLARRVAGQPVRYRLLGVADGLRSQECNGGFGSVGAVTRNGVVWIATMSGAASIDPRMVGEAAVVRTRIEAVLADGTTYPVATPVVIPPGLRRLEVHYLARTLLAPQRFVYRFMLKGYDQDFVEVQGTRTAVYTKLPPGRYQFKVQARLPGAPWGEMADPLSIVVRPRFYQTSWFLLVAVVSLGLLAGHTHVTRIRNVRARLFAVMEERQRIAREIHDTLSQGLTGISIHLESLGDSIREDPDAAETHLAWARQLVRESLAQARSTVWNLRSDDCSMRDLAGVLRRIGDGLTAGTGRTFEIKVSGTQPETPPQVEETLVRIGQEALTNATRHAAASSIEVELSFDRADIVLVVRDDGRGFDPDLTDSGTHFGIKGMRERAATVGGHVDISSTPGKGTVVSVTVPSRGRSSR